MQVIGTFLHITKSLLTNLVYAFATCNTSLKTMLGVLAHTIVVSSCLSSFVSSTTILIAFEDLTCDMATYHMSHAFYSMSYLKSLSCFVLIHAYSPSCFSLLLFFLNHSYLVSEFPSYYLGTYSCFRLN